MAVCVIVEFGKVGVYHRQGLKIDLFIIIWSFWCNRSHVVELWFFRRRIANFGVRIEDEDPDQRVRQTQSLTLSLNNIIIHLSGINKNLSLTMNDFPRTP
jgi:hypothetical protein